MQIEIVVGGPHVNHIVIERASWISRLPARIYTPSFDSRFLQTHHHAPAWAIAFTMGIYNVAVAAMSHVIAEGLKAGQVLNVGILEVSPQRFFFCVLPPFFN